MRTSSGKRSASATTGSGKRVGRLCERSTISMSTPGSPRKPSFSSTTPWATRAPVRERRQARLDDLPFARAESFAVFDPDDGVDLRVVRQDDLAPVLRLEAADDPLARPVEHSHDDARRAPGVLAAPASTRRPGLLLAGEDRVSVHRAVHPDPGHEQVVALLDEDEAEPLRADGDPAGDHVGKLDGRVLFPPDAGDLPAPLEGVQARAEGGFLHVAEAKGLHQLLERQDPRALVAQAVEDVGIGGQHGPESILQGLFGRPRAPARAAPESGRCRRIHRVASRMARS